MTLEKLQEQMITAMKNGDKPRKTAISGYIAAVKKVAIDKGCRDNITEEMVNETLTKLKIFQLFFHHLNYRNNLRPSLNKSTNRNLKFKRVLKNSKH